ncbi:MAG: hypothetical protein AB8G15_01995 [Saprospiraceae bacterium]
MKYLVLALFFCLLFCYACSDEPATEQPEKQALAMSPEALVRQWQNHIDNNRFEAAKKISSPQGMLEVDGIMKEIVDEDFPENFISETTFESILCQKDAQSAICICQVKEEEGRDSFFLVKEKDHWLFEKLVFENILNEDEMMDELEKDLNKLFDGETTEK